MNLKMGEIIQSLVNYHFTLLACKYVVYKDCQLVLQCGISTARILRNETWKQLWSVMDYDKVVDGAIQTYDCF